MILDSGSDSFPEKCVTLNVYHISLLCSTLIVKDVLKNYSESYITEIGYLKLGRQL